jgi:hypothetical protein
VKIIEINEKCQSCKGTGLYHGLGESDGSAVVCHTCGGTGCHKFRHEYEDFTERVADFSTRRVYEVNPGIGIGKGTLDGKRLRLEDLGGMPFEEWAKGKPFPKRSEMRAYTCPAWWYQCADYDKKPKWRECHENLGVSFSQCKHFGNKAKCWERWDKENRKEGKS